MGQRFIATETFEAEVNGSRNRYVEGQQYTIRDAPQYRDLAKKAQKWLSEGKIRFTGTTPRTTGPGTTVSTGGEK